MQKQGITIVRFALTATFVLAALASAGCSIEQNERAEAKQDWDSPRPAELEATLRHRLATTQSDN